MKWSTLCLGAVFAFTVTAIECDADDGKRGPFDNPIKEVLPGGDFGRGDKGKPIIRDYEGRIIYGAEGSGGLKGAEYNPCNNKTPPSWCPKP